jgi:hypothetical protein
MFSLALSDIFERSENHVESFIMHFFNTKTKEKVSDMANTLSDIIGFILHYNTVGKNIQIIPRLLETKNHQV